jgi:hypothetical protein
MELRDQKWRTVHAGKRSLRERKIKVPLYIYIYKDLKKIEPPLYVH